MKHGDRILAIETAPEGDVIVSAGADELLKFWQVYDKVRIKNYREVN